jgi:hypothetical protein
MELSYKPETRGPAVQGSAGLKRIWEVNIQAADGALIQSRHPETCSTRQCRVKMDMGSEHSERVWSSHASRRPGVLQYKAAQGLKGYGKYAFRPRMEVSYEANIGVLLYKAVQG